MRASRNYNRGLVKAIIVIIAALIALAYFGFDLKETIDSERLKGAVLHTWDFLKMLWNDYILRFILWVWNKIFVGFIWEDIIKAGIEKIRR